MVSKSTFYFQSDVWKLVLVLTVSLGLGLSCFLILIIIKLCRLYRGKVTKPLPKSLSSHINLDSDGVDFDSINSNLYTPLPEPKIMQISSPDDTSTVNYFKLLLRRGFSKNNFCNAFNFGETVLFS